MGAVLLLLVVITASMLCVRAGAIALELTGMAPDSARFQSVIATFASSLLQRDFLNTALNVGVISVALYVLYRLMWSRGLTQRISDRLRHWLVSRYKLRAPSLEEMIKVSEGMGVLRVKVQPQSPLAGKPLSELGLKTRKIQVLSILRGREIITVPQGPDVVLAGDHLVCYGSEETAGELFAAGTNRPPGRQ